MEDISTILYIIIGIIYVIYTALKKPKGQSPGQPTTRRPPSESYDDTAEGQPSGERRPTFEDLLREFQQAVDPERVPAPEPEPVPAPVEETIHEVVSTTTNPFDDYKQTEPTSIAEMYKESLFKAYDTEEEEEKEEVNETALEIRQMLMDPDGIKKAIIVNEILRSKYF